MFAVDVSPPSMQCLVSAQTVKELPTYPCAVYDHRMNIVSWNVNGIRAVVRKQMLQPCVATYAPDVICLQETKAHPGQVTLDLPLYPYQYWNGADRRGYAGTAIVSKIAPLAVHHGL